MDIWCGYISSFQKGYFDIVFFHASLHHFDKIHDFVAGKIKNSLKSDGLLVINEYVGPTRLQFPKHQIRKINEALSVIPKDYRARYKSNTLKNKLFISLEEVENQNGIKWEQQLKDIATRQKNNI